MAVEQDVVSQARVIHNFKARYSDELSLRFNEIVKVVETQTLQVSLVVV